MSDNNVSGPIDFVLIEFSGGKPLDGVAAALVDLVERGLVCVYDLVAVRKEDDGTFSGIAFDAAEAAEFGDFLAFTGARSGLLGDDDLASAADAMEPGTKALLVMFENAWARPFVAAARDAGGEMIASSRIPAGDVIELLDALETAN
ncbi:MAG: DUF1269 domain-containing protein [Acidimicrobiia bacterium]|nr:DUF1269 domain-containing protein [Acidimicrobiia bacterium]